MGVMRTFLPAWTKGPVVAQAPWDNPPLGLWRGGVPICGLFGVNKTPTKADNLGRDFWLSSVLSSSRLVHSIYAFLSWPSPIPLYGIGVALHP